ncbi:uncharacterized protein YktB (UPF0637 family) [Bacillus oleivorans]|uniref:UPF0637 protein SAMN05877753_1073 n=1 Tax=Bacillus oleivorans TaxID=1448271 RepID=A0A285D0P9_9BACI|nr:DUF1054 domain-containing protein [Bacillus oleivorans]SNX73255.1 uncharacterized protein YktB (UPF0637 family) [Bacillus oleivorans]
MSFTGFSQSDFDTFQIEGLEARMEAIENRIRPKFREIGELLTSDLSALAGNEMYLHIAKHARRTVNPPKDTWLAIANNKRGYKQHPHFQVGLFDDHVFIWLAFIYELPNKTDIAKTFLKKINQIQTIVPENYVISQDHMKKEAISVQELGKKGLKQSLERFRDIKKAEFLVGRHISSDDPILKNGSVFLDEVKETFTKLMPLYKLAYNQK